MNINRDDDFLTDGECIDTGDAKCPQVLLRRRFAVQRFVRRLGGSRHSLPSRLTPASEILTAPRGLQHRMTAISVLAVQPLLADL